MRDPRDLFDLSGRVAIVTGGTRGIGRAVAEGLAGAGARVVVASRKAEACEATAAELAADGADVLGVATHMGDLDSVRGLVDQTVAHFGAIDIIVNNAANALAQFVADLTPEAWDKSFAVNLRGPVFLVHHALPHLRQSEHASIVNVVSAGGYLFAAYTGMYAAAKAGLMSYTRSMAAEFAAEGIRVNSLAPGTVDTDMVRNNTPEVQASMAKAGLLGRAADPWEMVGPVLFLASDASSFMTGMTLNVDGGLVPGR